MNGLLTIGRFAQLTGLTIRALRLYDDLGLIRPVETDQRTGYRYYASEQLGRADLIRRLRQLDMLSMRSRPTSPVLMRIGSGCWHAIRLPFASGSEPRPERCMT